MCIWYACHRTAPAEVPWTRQSELCQGPVAHGRAALQGFCYTCKRQCVHTMYDYHGVHSHAAANNSPHNPPTRDAPAMGASKASIAPHGFQSSGRVLQNTGHQHHDAPGAHEHEERLSALLVDFQTPCRKSDAHTGCFLELGVERTKRRICSSTCEI